MLLRLDPGLARRVFAETEEATNLVAQFRHGFVVWLVRTGGHKIYRLAILSVYDIFLPVSFVKLE